MHSPNSKGITPSTAPLIRELIQHSLHRLPKGETAENIMEVLNVYIESKGQHKEAHTYLEESDFIQNIAKRIRSAKKSCTIKNLNTLFSYMQAKELPPILLGENFLLGNNPNDIINFIDMHLPDVLNSYSEWKTLFARLEEWESLDSKSFPLYNGYGIGIYASAEIVPHTRSLRIDISRGYCKAMRDESNDLYFCNDDFTLASQLPLFIRNIQDPEYITDRLIEIVQDLKIDIFSLFKIDPNDVQEWEDKKGE